MSSILGTLARIPGVSCALRRIVDLVDDRVVHARVHGPASRQRVTPDPVHAGEYLVEQLPSGEWIERAQYFEAVAVTGDGVFDTLKAVSKLVLKSLA